LEQCVLITGGAGFVGSNLAVLLKKNAPSTRVIALDNLKRRGSELTLQRLKANGIEFIHGDIRNRSDLDLSHDKISLIIECSAEPSVQAGYGQSPLYVLDTNLMGAINCFELARLHNSDVIFLSTSRVYPIEKLNTLAFTESENRYDLAEQQSISGCSENGISSHFSLNGYRSLYGTTKLSAELILQEYIQMYGLRGIINRCGVIAGPWQMGKVDQGVFSLWMIHHYFKKHLDYIGFGGTGKQVRDLLHIGDLFELIRIQMNRMETLNGRIYNVGGGRDISLSLLETTDLCKQITGSEIDIGRVEETHPADVRIYISDNYDVNQDTGWSPKTEPREILTDMYQWIKTNENEIKRTLL